MQISNLNIRWWIGFVSWLLSFTYETGTYMRSWTGMFAIAMFLSVFAPMFGGRVITLTIRRREDLHDDEDD